MLKFNPTTPILFYQKTATYVSGSGYNTSWTYLGRLYCEWRGAHGSESVAAQAAGVKYEATIRTFYHPDIYNALASSAVLIVKNADSNAFSEGVPVKSNPNLFQLTGGVDNFREDNHFLEFRVRRYEAT